MKTALAIVISFLMALPIGCEQNSSSELWKEYKLAGDSFSVKLPGPPARKVSTLKLPPGDTDQYAFTSRNKGCLYKVMYLDYPDSPLRIRDADSILDTVCEGSSSAINGHAAALKTISASGYPGREFTIETSDGKPLAYCRFYMVNNRLIQLMAVKRQSVKSINDIEVFLRSLKLLKSG